MTAEHNHPPRCCCEKDFVTGQLTSVCSACREHGEFADRPDIECPQCHQPAGRPHTEYCTLSPDAVWTDQLSGYVKAPDHPADWSARLVPAGATIHEPPPCNYPSQNHGDGRGCGHDDCPRHGHPDEP